MRARFMAAKHDDNSTDAFSPVAKYTFPISDSVALSAYLDTKPQNMKIANLQKGLIFVYNGVDVIGEGTGFGVPILKYSDETYFSGSSNLHVHKQGNLVVIRKEFFMDLVARERFRNIRLENRKIRTLIDYMSMLYQKYKRLDRSILLVKGLLLRFGVQPSFIRIPSKAKVTVTYIIDRRRILVEMNFSLLDRTNLEKVFVLNEQGAWFFRTYSDLDGLRLVDEEIGAWTDVKAQSAKITDYHERIGFGLKNMKGGILRRGRELLKDSLDWVGLDYELSPENDSFEYEIEILGPVQLQ